MARQDDPGGAARAHMVEAGRDVSNKELGDGNRRAHPQILLRARDVAVGEAALFAPPSRLVDRVIGQPSGGAYVICDRYVDSRLPSGIARGSAGEV